MNRVFAASLRRPAPCLRHAVVLSALAAAFSGFAFAQNLVPGNLVVSRSTYTPNDSVTVGQVLPPDCTSTTAGCAGAGGAIAGSEYPYVFNNVLYDSSFGITSKILLDEITVYGDLVKTIEVPNSTMPGIKPTSDQLVTSLSSKSEEALHLSLGRNYISFMDYVAPVSTVDASNSSTPAAPDPTNPVGSSYYRAVATVGSDGGFTFTETNAYSGNNGRAAIYNDLDGNQFFYTAGNAGNGSNPQPEGVVLGAGAQIIQRARVSEYQQNPGAPTPVASFSITALPANTKADKVGKDDNFRGMAVYKNVLYYTKGSGSNGINTVYFVDTTGTACPNGVGVPTPGAKLPTTPLAYNESTLAKSGLPSNMCILSGFPTTLAKSTTEPIAYPFGIWFANDITLYVADEGDGYTGGTDLYTHAAAQTTAGLQKWIYNTTTKTWSLAYTLQNGLLLGVPSAPNGYPSGMNSATGLPWTPSADGLRNIVGMLGNGTYPQLPEGKVAIYGITSTVSGGGDTGADPNRLMVVIDDLANTNPAVAAKETFYTVRDANYGEVLRGISFTPGTANITTF